MAAIKGLFSRLTLLGNGNHKHDDFHKAAESDLFVKTSPDVDGEECLRDCSACSVKLPSKWSIDESDKLYGHIKAWDRHVLVATGKSDWRHTVSDEPGSVLQAIDAHSSSINHGRLMLSASNMCNPSTTDSDEQEDEGATRCLLLPAFVYVDNVTPSTVPSLISSVINSTSTNSTPLHSASPSLPLSLSPTTDQPSTPFSITKCPHDYLILLCSHKTRDARCGQSAPLLRKEFERHLRPRGLLRDLDDDRPGGVGIFFISHVGGHKYSANVMIYRRAGLAGTEIPASTKKNVGDDANGGHVKEPPSSEEQATVEVRNEKTQPVVHDLNGEAPAPIEAAQCIWIARVLPEDCENIIRYTVLQGKVVKPASQLRGGFDRCKQLASW